MFDVIKSRHMITDELLQKLSTMDTATIHEAMEKRGTVACSIKPLDSAMKCCGRALTVQCHTGDNLMLIKAVSMAARGDVIVADMGNNIESGSFGEILATECIKKKCAGLVISGCVRDTKAIISMNFPVFSKGVSILGTVKASKGKINHSVIVGNELINPGDIIVGDRDGVVVIPFDRAEQVYFQAVELKEKEALIKQRIKKGESLFDIYGYQDIFDNLSVTEE